MKSKIILVIALLTFIQACDKVMAPEPFIPPLSNQSGVITDSIDGKEYVVYSNVLYNVLVAYRSTKEDGENVSIIESQAGFPIIFEDNLGNSYNLFGQAITGPDQGEYLKQANFQVGYWFSLSSMFEEVSLYEQDLMERKENQSYNDWLINPQDVRQGAIKDAIPALDNPKFDAFQSSEQSELIYEPEDLIIIAEEGPGVKLYPHAILNWHEVVNDEANGSPVTISYCPLTGTSAIWGRTTGENEILSFGVSGLLYNSNLILYDRNSESLWSQILETAVHGEHLSYVPQRIRSLEVNWLGAQLLADDLRLLSENTGFTRNYDLFPYGEYKTNGQVYYPLTFNDQRLHPKERVLAIISDNKVVAYRASDF